MAALVELSGISRTVFDGAKRRDILREVSLSVDPGEMVALVGASGCGKTTLLQVIGALDSDFSGQAKILGRALEALDDDARAELRNEGIGFVFQSFHLLDHLSVGENVAVPLWLAKSPPVAREEARLVREALSVVGLGDRTLDSVRPLSGGERQRVAIARALVHGPTLLLADEPTGNLDRETGRTIYGLFDQIRRDPRRGCAVVVATHDAELAKAADRVLTIQGGEVEAR